MLVGRSSFHLGAWGKGPFVTIQPREVDRSDHVVLSEAKNLASVAIQPGSFAAMKIGKSLAYASGYYFHRLWGLAAP